ncbi:AbrB/MazE/SpoVT family DNA-binding domain-containing protein [Halobacillus salinarum]|uniref:AbrB/MazE/SpoVT family DNA-binding domain-containing protein n=1 Tax=Halobacillus salinarum TaxID=2932257 RepID=A0ABY4EM88_9BACI|nr:AbrB/MazE/SpoVT family DNA-binding domain-containing protein [Halobacillus salinarum]UOQ45564.1 AbrB/MazE/SpoVT family DNA-binding domain-containing protein [Halobacillus salinarum]
MSKVEKWGEDLAIRLPEEILKELGVKEGDHVYLSVRGKDMEIAAKRKKYSVEELVSRITEENKHEEIDWGKPEGKEFW